MGDSMAPLKLNIFQLIPGFSECLLPQCVGPPPAPSSGSVIGVTIGVLVSLLILILGVIMACKIRK